MLRPRRTHTAYLVSVVAFLGSAFVPAWAQNTVGDQSASDAAAYALHLTAVAGELATDAMPNLLDSDLTAFDPASRYVLQLHGPITPEQRARFEAAGVLLGDYLPDDAYVVDLAGVAPQTLRDLGLVQWLGEYQNAWKVQPGIGDREYLTPERQQIAAFGNAVVDITLFEGADVDAALQAVQELAAEHHRTEILNGNPTLTVTMPLANVPLLADIPQVQFVEETPELTMRNSTTRWIIQTNTSGSTPVYDAGIHGEGQIVGVLDGKVDQNHCSFAGKILAYNTTPGADTHGTHVACTAIGDNGANDNTRGIAYEGQLVFNDVPSYTETGIDDALSLHHTQGARVHTNSWGDDGTTAYNTLCRGIDSFSYNHQLSLVLFAVTNTSSLKNPENAKNLLAVGASQDTPNQDNHCSGGVGPTSDGRRKPEVYAPGCSTISAYAGTSCGTVASTGTSMASPAVAGAALLVRQYYTDGYYPTGVAGTGTAFNPTGALVKATLINSAVDMTGVSGYPSNLEGWGRIKLNPALHFDGQTRQMFVEDVRNNDGMTTGQTAEYAIDVTDSSLLKVTLVWTDPPATAGAATAWVNDLDLEVIAPDASIYKGNVFSGGESATGGAADARNNVEQVHISSPQTGMWTLRVNANAVNQGTQGYAIIATGVLTPASTAFTISLPTGAPAYVDPGVTNDFDVQITPGDESIVSADLMVSVNGGSYTPSALTPAGGDLYVATLPAVDCEDTLDYYIEAVGDGSTVKTLPSNAPASVFSSLPGEVVIVAADDMEASSGWTVGAPDDDATTGIWNRMNPEATDAQPEDDHTASGTMCWVTDGNAGSSQGVYDVDGGKTTLYSPVYDLSGLPDATVSYWRWYANNTGSAPNEDVFTVDITNNGTTWVNVETVGPSGEGTSGGWIEHTFDVASLVSPTASVQLRFVAADEGSGSIVEAAIDDLRIDTFLCMPPTSCPGDLDNSGAVDLTDLGMLLGDYGCTGPACIGDISGDDVTDLTDLGLLLGAYGSPCP